MKIACVILNYNDHVNTLKLVQKIQDYENISYIVVVDNKSTDGSYSILKNNTTNKIHCICTSHNGGYGAGNNYGARYCFQKLGADAILICNPDVSFEKKLVDQLQDIMQKDEHCGVVSAIQRDKNNIEINQSAWRIPSITEYIFSVGKIGSRLAKKFYISAHELHQKSVTKVGCVAGSLLLVSKEAFEKTGGYDENVFLYCEETILGCKMKTAGYNTYVCSDVDYLHLHGVTITKNVSSTIKRKKILLKSHRYTLKTYFEANALQMLLNDGIGKISILEEYMKEALMKVFQR